ncbi:hypothetical protein [Olivibacter sp. SDN3]|uniref:hypothetical protein n=1 Tax=Olivibacter sp. SDN3 TaxID=2764720 RepID=UPI001C9E2FBD|nr:hypothetical protein [Olivibacter sp. SDN3]
MKAMALESPGAPLRLKGMPVPEALQDIDKGGAVICGGIHMSTIPSFPYALLWEERSLQSLANLTRQEFGNLF